MRSARMSMRKETGVQAYLKFRKMITPVIIQVIFWLGTALCVIAGIVGIIGGLNARSAGGGQVLIGLLLLILGPVAVRIYCELLIVIFRIHDTLTSISDKLDDKTK